MARAISKTTCLIPVLFLATFFISIFIMMGASPASLPVPVAKPKDEFLKYTTVTGYFQQSHPATDDKSFDYTTTNFGLIERSYEGQTEADEKKTQWEKFDKEVARLNAATDEGTQYKVLFMGRHGEGYHNVAEAFYGTKNWDCYWSLQNGNETATWADALLTPTGEAQALKANAFWHSLITDHNIQTPQSYYTSPLLRCMATADLTFSGLPLPEEQPFRPLIKELIREVIGAHTCDRRSSKSVIAQKYPDWAIEEGFEEEDPLWDAELRESDEALDIRLREGLDEIFGSDKNSWISISSHSGALGAVLRVLGHRVFRLGTGQVIPVLVKAEKIVGKGPPRAKGPYFKISTCAKPPPPPTPIIT